MKTQLEETRRIKEILRNQLDEKDKTCQKLDMEVVGLRKKDKNMMPMSSSTTIQSFWMRFWIIKDLHLTTLVLATTSKKENMRLAHGLLRLLKQSLQCPRTKANLLVKNLHNIRRLQNIRKTSRSWSHSSKHIQKRYNSKMESNTQV